MEKKTSTARYMRRRRNRIAQHLCTTCGVPLEEGDTHRQCMECRAKTNSTRRKLAEEARAKGICTCCLHRPAREGFSTCKVCFESRARRERAVTEEVAMELLSEITGIPAEALAEYRLKGRKMHLTVEE